MKPWICPRCSRVYGPSALECGRCNREVEDDDKIVPHTFVPGVGWVPWDSPEARKGVPPVSIADVVKQPGILASHPDVSEVIG